METFVSHSSEGKSPPECGDGRLQIKHQLLVRKIFKTQWLHSMCSSPSVWGGQSRGNMSLPGMAECFQPALPDHPELVSVQLIDMFWQVLLSTKTATGATCGVDRGEAERRLSVWGLPMLLMLAGLAGKDESMPQSLGTEFHRGLWHPRCWGRRASPWFSISASWLPVNQRVFRTLIGSLYLLSVAK